jgi:Fe-S cluster biogenesis protein NfuA
MKRVSITTDEGDGVVVESKPDGRMILRIEGGENNCSVTVLTPEEGIMLNHALERLSR